MSSEERQRTIRQQGSRPAQAEKADKARAAREALGQQEGERRAEHDPEAETTPPLPEDDPSKPRPRR
jgi:hypothetical protein